MSILGNYDSSILSAGRRIFGGSDIGLSANARALNQQFLSSANGLLSSLGSIADSQNSTEALQTKILALRASTPTSQLSRALQEERTVTPDTTRGTEVDEEA